MDVELPPPPTTAEAHARQKLSFRIVAFLGFVALVWFLREAQVVMMSLAIAALIAVVVGPMVQTLDRRLPHWLALTLGMAAVIVALLGVTALLGWLTYSIASELPAMMPRLQQRIAPLVDAAENWGIDLSPQGPFVQQARDFVMNGVNSVTSGLAEMVIVVFLAGFMVAEIRQFRRKTARAFDERARDRVRVSVHAMVDPVRRYIVVKSAISALSGVIAGLVAWAFDLPLAVAIGVLTFLLNFIPNIGSILAIVPPALFALVQYDSLWIVGAIIAILAIIDTVIGNYLDPRVLGDALQLSPLVVLFSMIFWGWLWGLVGVFIAVPLTVALKVLACHFEFTRPLGVFLGTDPDCDIVLEQSREYIEKERRRGFLLRRRRRSADPA